MKRRVSVKNNAAISGIGRGLASREAVKVKSNLGITSTKVGNVSARIVK